MKDYKYILFDCDDTVLDFLASEKKALVSLFNEYGIKPTKKAIDDYIEINERYWKLYEAKVMSRDEILIKRFEEFFSKFNLSSDYKEVNEKYLTLLTKNVEVVDGISEVLDKLKDKYELYIITNGVKWTQEERLRQTEVRKYFKDFFISEAIGYQKPDKEFFKFVIEKIGDSDLSHYLVVGDSISSDILGGINAGIDTLWFNLKGIESSVKPTYEIKEVGEYLDILL